MTIEELIKTIIVQMPAIGILLYFVNRLYTDWQVDRTKATEQREQTLKLMAELLPRVENIEQTIDIICDTLDKTLTRNPPTT